MRFSRESLPISESEFVILRDLIRERTGLSYDDGKQDLLADKLSGRALERGCGAFIDYYYLLKYGPGADEEWPYVHDALSVPETYFWREMDQVRALVDVLVPRHFAGRGAGPLRIWSAACATGEEPLTLAMALAEAGWLGRVPVTIAASDASPAAVDRARLGRYRERSFRVLPPALRTKYFTPDGDAWRVVPELQAPIEWSVTNLVAAAEVAKMPVAAVVFCRNVFIYFALAAMSQAVRLIAGRLTVPGYLFVGTSESLLKIATDFELQELGGAFVYVKR